MSHFIYMFFCALVFSAATAQAETATTAIPLPPEMLYEGQPIDFAIEIKRYFAA